MTAGDFEEKAFLLGQFFKPTTPISQQDLFSGRQSQVRDVIDAVNQQGQHAVLYGERGVGKTSLANMIFPKLRTPIGAIMAPHVNCMTVDTFHDVWRRVFEEITFFAKTDDEATLEGQAKKMVKHHIGPMGDPITPDIVRRILHQIGEQNTLIVILDEFDQIEADETMETMSDTLKFLSDRNVNATVVLVGVANDVDSLIRSHQSLERCLRQIPMPRMNAVELEAIVRKGLSRAQMTITESALDQIAELARGLPHYAHLLGLHSGRAALDKQQLQVDESHVQTAISVAIGKAQASIQSDYNNATKSSREESLYRQVLLACAIAETDELGWFYPRAVREPLEVILGRPYDIASFARHLASFCETSRGPVLVRGSEVTRPRYRFENPLMQPYVLIRGLAEHLITPNVLRKAKSEPSKPSGQGVLFE